MAGESPERHTLEYPQQLGEMMLTDSTSFLQALISIQSDHIASLERTRSLALAEISLLQRAISELEGTEE